MFNKLKMIAIIILVIIVVWPSPAMANTEMSKELVVRDTLDGKASKIGDYIADFDKKAGALHQKVYTLLEAIPWEKPTKERVLLMVLSSELNSVKMSAAGSYLAIKSLPFIDVKYLDKEINKCSTLLNVFFWTNMLKAAENIGHHLSAYGDEKLTAEFYSVLEHAGNIFGKCSGLITEMRKAVPVLVYLEEGEKIK